MEFTFTALSQTIKLESVNNRVVLLMAHLPMRILKPLIDFAYGSALSLPIDPLPTLRLVPALQSVLVFLNYMEKQLTIPVSHPVLLTTTQILTADYAVVHVPLTTIKQPTQTSV